MFNKLMKDGIEKIYSEDMNSQRTYIENICKVVREMPSDIIYKAQGFFVPNDEYMIRYFTTSIKEPAYDCYHATGICYWHLHLVFPVYDVANEIVGLVGFNPINKLKAKEEGQWDLPAYRHSSKTLFNKSKYLFMLKDTFRKALENGYIVLTDGVFDMLSFTQNNVISGALLGSYVSEELFAMLRLLDRVYVSIDNDEAGLKLYNQLNRSLSNVIVIKQNQFKDADDILKSKYRDKFLKEFFNNLNNPIKMDLIFRV